MKDPHVFRAFQPELVDGAALPAGVIGQVRGIALVYGEIDTHGSTFERGALERTMRERVAAGKVKLYWDHGDAPMTGFYDSDLHIGTVKSLTDVQLEDGRWAAYMVADLFDVPKAHLAKQYIQGVLASGGETGLSIGGMKKGIKSSLIKIKGVAVERITEFPLSEISITSMQAVPDSEVLAVRAEVEAAIAQVNAETAADEAEAGSAISSAIAVPFTLDVVEDEACTALSATADATPSWPTTGLSVVSVAPYALANRISVADPEPLVVRADRPALEAAFDTLLLALPVATVRARVRAVLGDADPKDRDAPATVTGDTDAEATDSRTTPLVVYATMEDRLAALRLSYSLRYPTHVPPAQERTG